MATMVRSFREAGQTLVLRDLGTHQELLLGQVPILTSAALETERAFGRLARDLGPPRADSTGAPPPGPRAIGEATAAPPRVIIGGLGFGATLEGALSVLEGDAEVIVVEKLATVVDLVRAGIGGANPRLLEDPRVVLLQRDIADVIAEERNVDVILLDVDNGPEWASFQTNARLYAASGLSNVRRALVSLGALAVWSGYPVNRFMGRLREAELLPSVVPLHEGGRVRARAYVGRKQRA